MLRQPGPDGASGERDKESRAFLEQGRAGTGANPCPPSIPIHEHHGTLDRTPAAVRAGRPRRGHGIDELARRLGMSAAELLAVRPTYREFQIPKRSGGTAHHGPGRIAQGHPANDPARGSSADSAATPRLTASSAAGRSSPMPGPRRPGRRRSHGPQGLLPGDPSQAGAKVLPTDRLEPAGGQAADAALHVRGWPAARGAPTSPRLSNLINYRLDARLTGLAARRRLRDVRTGSDIGVREIGATYTRYADDLTFSFPTDDPHHIRYVIRLTTYIVGREGYELHLRKKLQIRRQHDRQQVTGLVVNERVNLPRSTRRWLRAVEHRAPTRRSINADTGPTGRLAGTPEDDRPASR